LGRCQPPQDAAQARRSGRIGTGVAGKTFDGGLGILRKTAEQQDSSGTRKK